MPKKLLSLFLCLCLLPSFALAADFDPAAYSDEELEAILRLIVAHLYSEKEEEEALLLYEDENIALHYSSFDEIGDEENLYLNLLASNKTDHELTIGLMSVGINSFSIGSGSFPFLAMRSEAILEISLSRTKLAKYPIETFQNISLGFSYWFEDKPLSSTSRCVPAFTIPDLLSSANSSLSKYSQIELETMGKKQLQLLLQYLDPPAALLYEDRRIAVYYWRVDEQGDDENIYFDVIICNKTERFVVSSFKTVLLNNRDFEIGERNIGITPYSSTIAQIPINREDYKKTLADPLESIALEFKHAALDNLERRFMYTVKTDPLTLPINH